jgi:hypothetical protein
MEIYLDWVVRNPGKDKQAANVEFVLKILDKYLDLAPPIGFQYIQYPSNGSNDYDIAFPENERPTSLFPGTTWAKLWADEGVFFRTEGGKSSNLRTNGKQEDAIRNIQGTIGLASFNAQRGGTGMVDPKWYNNSGSAESGSGSGIGGGTMKLNADIGSVAANPMAGHANGTDIRPVNRLFIIWKRIS